MTAQRIAMTYHAREERTDRLTYIAMTVGFGNVVLTSRRPEEKKIDYLTDTGVLMIKGEDGALITAYICDINKAFAIYKKCGFSTVPPRINAVIRKNRIHLKMQNEVRY